MDTKAYLMGQGWSGPGNPLNPSHRPGVPHAGLGLTKPILVARKRNTHGIGKKTTHDHTNQWWLRGFEEALKGVGNDGSATPTTSASEENNGSVGIRSELYRFFVRGEGLKGTIGTRVDAVEVVTGGNHATKRKRDKDAEEVWDLKSRDSGKRKRKRTKEKLSGIESLAISSNEDTMETTKRKVKRTSKVSQEMRDITSGNGEIELREKKSEKERKRKKRCGEDSCTEASPNSDSSAASNHITYPQISDKDARKRRKELERAKKDAKGEANEKPKKSKNRKKKRKKEER
ncbi:hypothetical protein PRK78_000227 [Emydomyces testavorans]|uniref:G-patch domain-containing protein n=1 Tax=Emydomyces testavorans TaxID=2070801 RepID=A0AAF0DC45_9EURO|nr:hypothetical protein PRK78_000227 [Emydomyces testavorans]